MKIKWTNFKDDNEELREVCGIYSIRNIVNHKQYIGSSNNIFKRIREHRQGLRKGDGINNHFQNAYNKYGENSFEYNIIEKCKEEIKLVREQYYLTLLKPEYNGSYNVMANTGQPRSEVSKQRASDTEKKMVLKGYIDAKPAFIYNVSTLTLSMYCNSIKDARKLLNITSGSKIEDRLYKNKYIISLSKFTTQLELLNRINKSTMKSPQRKVYIIVENSEGITYYKTSTEIRNKYKISIDEFYKKHNEATKENPYILPGGDLFYYSLEYIPITDNKYNIPIEYITEFNKNDIKLGAV